MADSGEGYEAENSKGFASTILAYEDWEVQQNTEELPNYENISEFDWKLLDEELPFVETIGFAAPMPVNNTPSHTSNTVTASQQWDYHAYDALPPEAQVLETSIPANHGSSQVPIVVTSPLMAQWPAPTPAIPLPDNPYYPPISRSPSAAPNTRPGSRTPEGSFNNSILNRFTNPSAPLRVIDTYKFPFETELQMALEGELERQNEMEKKQEKAATMQKELNRRRESDEVLQADLDILLEELPVPVTPAPTPAGNGSKTPRNRRKANISNTNPEKWYQPLVIDPDTHSWGDTNPETLKPIFTYTEKGELDPQLLLSVQQMSDYIASGRATLWIQCVPADSSKRYATPVSDKCRFLNCPDPKRTIRKGDFRVAYDEFPSNPHKDPFRNTAYTHLYCLEKSLDFPQMCKDKFDIRPDIRVLKEGKNKMAITRDHASMAEIVTKFKIESQPWRGFDEGRPRPDDWYVFSLCSKLTKEHLERQNRGVQSVREERGRDGNTLDKHQNNLDVYVANQKQRKANPKVIENKEKSTRKRKIKRPNKENGENSDESGLDDDILQRGLLSPALTSSAKKRRKLSELECLRRWSWSSVKRKFKIGTLKAKEEEEEKIEQHSKRLRSGRRIPFA